MPSVAPGRAASTPVVSALTDGVERRGSVLNNGDNTNVFPPMVIGSLMQ